MNGINFNKKNINAVINDRFNQIADLKQGICDYVKVMLAMMGEQGFKSSIGLSVLMLDALNENCDEVDFNLDRIKLDERGNIIVHDIFTDEWTSTRFFGYDKLSFVIRFIDWK